MENDEIRRKIAELKGCVNPELRCALADMHVGHALDYPNWPENIADAFELVEEMQSEPYLQAIQITRVPAIATRWVIWVGANIALSDDTLPRAISLAFIAWKEAQG